MTELIGNNIKYDYTLGVGGARFVLFPLVGYHTAEDIQKAKKQLRIERDVLSINTEPLEWDEWKSIRVWLEILHEKNIESNTKFHLKIYEQYKKERDKDNNEEK